MQDFDVEGSLHVWKDEILSSETVDKRPRQHYRLRIRADLGQPVDRVATADAKPAGKSRRAVTLRCRQQQYAEAAMDGEHAVAILDRHQAVNVRPLEQGTPKSGRACIRCQARGQNQANATAAAYERQRS